jgi:hypothetical protein
VKQNQKKGGQKKTSTGAKGTGKQQRTGDQNNRSKEW